MTQPLTDDEFVIAYHERTKHHYHRTAASLGYLDWDSQPDPFRRFAGAELLPLPLAATVPDSPFDRLYAAAAVPAAPLCVAALAQFFRLALSVTAWKSAGGARWSLRANPSSGNLHPTEGYAVLPAVGGWRGAAGVHHYAPREHGLEQRCACDAEVVAARLPAGAFLVGLTSIAWREAWKYGERAFRYCQHDIGHALGSLRYAAAALGWRLWLHDGVSDACIASLLGVDREADYAGAEREAPECLVLVATGDGAPRPLADAIAALARDLGDRRWHGQANVLSTQHVADWDVIDEVTARSRKSTGAAPPSPDWSDLPHAVQLHPGPARASSPGARAVILGRRSAVAMDARTAIGRDTFLHMMARLVPQHGNAAMPFDLIPWRPHVHLGLFVHRVGGLARGLYALVRDPAKVVRLRAAMRPEFVWRKPEPCPPGLELYLLAEGAYEQTATAVSCGQEIAGDGAFALAMLGELFDGVRGHGAWFYRRLFWEAGLVGQVLYLEAEAASVRATGIGCYFDDPAAGVFGLRGTSIASLYHFTVGGPVEDSRLTTSPGYPARP
ncbi:MAG: hypothetical protein U1E76_00880 [Planctomycetota bacterium]